MFLSCCESCWAQTGPRLLGTELLAQEGMAVCYFQPAPFLCWENILPPQSGSVTLWEFHLNPAEIAHEKLLWSKRGELHPESPTGRTSIPGFEIQVLLQRLLRPSIFLWFSPVLPSSLRFLSPGTAGQQLCDTSLCQHCSGTDWMEAILAQRHFSCSLTQNPQLSLKLQAPKEAPNQHSKITGNKVLLYHFTELCHCSTVCSGHAWKGDPMAHKSWSFSVSLQNK